MINVNTLPEIPVSIGELMDKWVILQIKAIRIHDKVKLENVLTELETLNDIASPYLHCSDKVIAAEMSILVNMLTEVNEVLWDIEDDIRDLERRGIPQQILGGIHNDSTHYDQKRFVELAREVYITNDKRCAIKRKINELLLSGFLEEKSYTEY